MKKITLLSSIFLLLLSCNPLENITIINDTEFVYKFKFPGEEIIVDPGNEYSFNVIGVYSEEHREYLGNELKKITLIEKYNNETQIFYANNEEGLDMIKKGLAYRNNEWIILCSKLNLPSAREFEKDCDLCSKIHQNEVSVTLRNYVYNDMVANISEKAKSQLTEIKETLRNGHKFIECGCKDDKLIYRLWCANDETFELEVELFENNQYIITGIHAAEFSHP